MQPYTVFKVLSSTYGVTVGTTITSFPSVPTNAMRVLFQVETNDIRMRFDSTNTVTYGVGGGIVYPVNTVANPVYIIEGYDKICAARMRASASASTSKVNIFYEGEGQSANES
jgi:hypothetical protein